MRPTVLIVDDTELLRFLLRETLAELSLGLVAEAGTPEEAVRLAEALAPRLVVVDWTATVDPAALLGVLRRSCRDAVVAAAVPTGDRRLAAAARRAGADALLERPYTAARTLPRLKSLLAPAAAPLSL